MIKEGGEDLHKLEKYQKKKKNVVSSGHYVIASSQPPERQPLERCPLVPISSKTLILFPKEIFSFGTLALKASYIQ